MRHPLHALFTHFPIALWLVTPIWDILGLWRGDAFWWEFSHWSIAVGLIFAVLTVVTGFIDYIKMPHQGPEEMIAMKHMVIVFAAAGLFAGSYFVRIKAVAMEGMTLLSAMGLSLAGCLLLIIGAWFGGELVHHYGVGRVKDTPAKE